jgi:hypothetical protein
MMAPASELKAPEVGQAVRVRNRLATVRAVEPYDSRDAQGRLHIVEVEYLDDCRFPEAEQLLWEVEATATILGKTSLPSVDAHRPALLQRRADATLKREGEAAKESYRYRLKELQDRSGSPASPPPRSGR